MICAVFEPIYSFKALVKLHNAMQLSLSFIVFVCLHFSWFCYYGLFFLTFVGPQARTQVSPTNKNLTPPTHSVGNTRGSALFVQWEPCPGSTASLITVAPVHCKYDKSRIKMRLYIFRLLQVIWHLFTVKRSPYLTTQSLCCVSY